MKNTVRYSFALLLCGLLAACSITQRMEKRGRLSTSPDPQKLSVDQTTEPNTLHVDYMVHVPRNYVPRKAQVIFQTDLVNGDDRLPVSKIYLNGRTFERLMWREARFEGRRPDYSDGVTVVSGRNPFTVTVADDFDFEAWMSGAVLEATTTVYLCEAGTPIGSRRLSNGVQYTPPAPIPVVIEPTSSDPEPVIRREEEFVSLSYAINSFRIDPAYGDNAVQLERITGLLDKILSDSLFTVDRIVVTGVCSPDGSYSYNSDLARNRAETVREYLISRLGVDPRLIQTNFIPEDWEGLHTLVEASDLTDREAILSIIDGTQSPNAKKAALKRLPQYQTLKTTFFPLLRQVKYEIRYTEKIPAD